MELINKTIGQCLWEQAERNGDHIAVETSDWSCTYRQLNGISDALAEQMEALGIIRGTHVGIWSVNSPDWVFTFLALSKIGAVPVLINTCYKEEEIKGLLNYSDVEVLYYGTRYKTIIYEDIIAAIRKDTPKVRHFIHIDEDQIGKWAEETALENSEDIGENPGSTGEYEVLPSDAACMIFTSGTTSLPKGVELSHYNVINNARAMIQAMKWSPEDKMCITVPLFHCFGITAGIVACILEGMSMHLIPYFKTAKVWDAIEDYHCTILNGVPSMFLALIRREEYADRDGSGLRSGIIAGSPITGDEFEEICRRFPGMHLQPSYGQTETSPCVAIAGWEESVERKAVSAGKVIEHVQVRIADLNTGKSLGTGEDGEIQVKGYNVMTGYYNLPKANEKAFTEDGWLRTGDIGRLDEEGELHITGRLKEMIIRAGENISPQEIEQVIRGISWVSEVKVVGVPAEVLQEEIAACIVPKKGWKAKREGKGSGEEGRFPEAEQEVRDYVKPRLAHYKVPAYVLFFDEFPMNASGKINLKILKEMAREGSKKQKKEKKQ